MGIQYKPTKQKKEKPVKAPKAPKAEKAMKLGTVATVKPTKAQKPPKPEKAPKMAKAMKFESQKPMQIGKVQDSAKSGNGALRQPVKPAVVIAVFAVLAVVVLGIVVASFFMGGDFGEQEGNVRFQSLKIASLPEKTVYAVGEAPVYYGLTVEVTLSSGTVVTLDATDCEITGFDSSVPVSKQTITVSYKNLSTFFDIAIIGEDVNNPSTPSIHFNGLSFKTLPKTEYKVGEYLSIKGGVLLLHYDDGSTKEIPLDYNQISGFTSEKPGTYTISVKYYEDGFLAEITYTITVTE